MKPRRIAALAFAAGLSAAGLTAADSPPAVAIATSSNVEEGIVDAPIDEVWGVWSTPAGWRISGVAKVDIDFRPGGLIRTHYKEDGVLGDPGTIENRILAYEPPRMLAIQIAKPPTGFPFPHAWQAPWTVITLTPIADGRTSVRLASVGFGADDESRRMLEFFKKGNHWTLEKIQAHFAGHGGNAGR